MYGKLLIRCKLTVLTGMHIGGSDTYSAIGAVDSPVIRDPRTHLPIVPGSSLKGKLRSLLAKSTCRDVENMPSIEDDDTQIKHLFGSADPVQPARLQFVDAFVSNFDEMKAIGLTEVKSENVIDRQTSAAKPRQIERVVSGVTFDVCMTYQLTDEKQAMEDMSLLVKGMRLLQMDYLGGHGSRGSGRVSLHDFRLEQFGSNMDIQPLLELFREVEKYELFTV